VPTAVTDLAGHQQGNGAQLVFTMPGHTTTGDRLAQPPSAEIFRGSLKPDGKPDEKSFRLVYTIPGALLHDYAAEGKIRFTEPIAADELRSHPATVVAYRVRTRLSAKKDSADSNTVTATLYPVPEKLPAPDAKVSQNSIDLAWPAAVATNSDSVIAYHVYRGELDAGSDLAQPKWKTPLTLLAEPQLNSYSDTLFEFDKTYVYYVRSVITARGNSIESDDSAPTQVTPRDTFPPAAPQNLVATVLPGENNSHVVDLSWSINTESDFAGYRIYRSSQQGDRGQLLQKDLLLSPSFRDTTTQPGQQYWYTVTAVDRAGNESAASDQIPADVNQP
jgi:fibronectin type 3 domain-containing protein